MIDAVPWQATALSTNPPSREVSAAETARLDIDVTAQLGVGETVDTGVPPAVAIYPLIAAGVYHEREAALTPPVASWVAGDVVRVSLAPGYLTYGRTYEQVILFAITGTTDRRPAQTFLLVRA